jgi:hypothetical protein
MRYYKLNINNNGNHRFLPALLGILLLTMSLSYAFNQTMRVVKTDEGYQFYEDNSMVLFYRIKPLTTKDGTYSRANYCHPVLGLNGGVITEDFPKDHLHHRGIFWAWHQVYVEDQLIRDMWDCTDFIWDFQRVNIIESGNKSTAISAIVNWESPQWKDASEPIAQEMVMIRLHKTENNIRMIDFEITISALVKGLRIGGSDDDKGYGGFSTRIPLPDDLVMTDKNGEVTPARIAVEAGEWMNFNGTFNDEKSNIAVFIHPSHPGAPYKWILRKRGSCQNVAYPGREPVSIPMDRPLQLKYRVVIHKDADLNKLFADYSGK